MNATARPTETHVTVKSLSPLLRRALKRVDYGARTIAIQPTDTVSMFLPGNDGSKGFAMLIRLDTGSMELHEGSFGGWPEDASRLSPVDSDRSRYPLPPNGVVIVGSMGYPRTFATIYVPLAEAARFLPTNTVELTRDERHVLFVCQSILSAYRADELRRREVETAMVPGLISGLVARGLLNRNRAGAVSITVDGRNAIAGWDGYDPAPVLTEEQERIAERLRLGGQLPSVI